MSGSGDEAWLLREVEVDGARCDVRLRAGRVERIGRRLPDEPGERTWRADGGALLPGLNDHHIHLFALAAALDSVRCGPPEVRDAEALAAALHAAAVRRPAGGTLRGVGYHERVAGDLDRHALDRLGPDCPIRVQHRSGARWILNSRALERLGTIAPGDRPPGLEVDAAGRPTGRLDRADAWLRGRLGESALPDLARVGRLLASCGVTGACDATPTNDARVLDRFAAARHTGALPQRLRVMGRPDLPPTRAPGLERGAVKWMLDENALPDRDALVSTIARAHADDRGVAFHCVTRAELVFALSALEAAGPHPGDRLEHASIAPPDCVAWTARLGISVVSQPNFVAERGDEYVRDVDARDHPWLYRCRGFLDAAVPFGAGTDAPFGEPDPWRAMRAAVDRRTADGVALAADERLTAEQALALFTTPLDAPGGRPRRVEPGAPADLCLLDRGWRAARDRLNARDVVGVWVGGRRVSAGP